MRDYSNISGWFHTARTPKEVKQVHKKHRARYLQKRARRNNR